MSLDILRIYSNWQLFYIEIVWLFREARDTKEEGLCSRLLGDVTGLEYIVYKDVLHSKKVSDGEIS